MVPMIIQVGIEELFREKYQVSEMHISFQITGKWWVQDSPRIIFLQIQWFCLIFQKYRIGSKNYGLSTIDWTSRHMFQHPVDVFEKLISLIRKDAVQLEIIKAGSLSQGRRKV